MQSESIVSSMPLFYPLATEMKEIIKTVSLGLLGDLGDLSIIRMHKNFSHE